MEPKDLKNSNNELEITPQEPISVEKQDAQSQTEEIQIIEEQVIEPEKTESATPETVIESKEVVQVEADIEKPEVAQAETIAPATELTEQPVVETPTVETPAVEETATPIVSEEETADAENKPELPPEAELSNDAPIVEKQIVDYSGKTEVELINMLRELVEGEKSYDNIKEDVDNIKFAFYKIQHTETEKKKKAFYAEHDKEEEFVLEENIYENDLKNLLDGLRHLKIEHNKKQEADKESNLELKYQIIEDIKALINNKESINKTFHDFRELQNKWRDVGLVPQSKLKDLWDTYHHHVENFYDYIKINKELRDLDLKKNMEAKMEICEKSEELLVEPSIIKAFNVLQKYHEQWREIGPVPREKKDELWERFKAVTTKINKKHQDFFESRKSEQKTNLDAKIMLCEKAEEICTSEKAAHKDWDDKSRELVELQKVWRTIGFAPRKDNNKIYERFRKACDQFFNEKREFYSQNKEIQTNNLQMKTDLCVQAESLKDSTDWKKATDDFIDIQRKWKEIGPVPRKQSDIVWKRFRAACDFFFEEKSKHFSSVDTNQIENLKLKQDLISEVQAYKIIGDESKDLEHLKEFQRKFTEIGHVPFKDKDKVQNDFRDAINNHFDNLRIDEKKRNILKFKTKVSNLTNNNRGYGKMRFEREKYMAKLKQLESDLALLDNNIGFFANTKNAKSLIGDVILKMENTKEKIEFLKEKIRIIDATEDTDE